MKIALMPEGFTEVIQMAQGAIPAPMGHTWCAPRLARWIMAGARCGIFDALEEGPRDVSTVAGRCGLNADATERLFGVLVSAGYLTHERGLYGLTALSRKWLVSSGASSLHDNLLFQYIEWRLLEATEQFLSTGRPIDLHAVLTREEWGLYQRSMRSLAGVSAAEVVERTPVPTEARAMLDVGGSHGFYSVSLCRKHPHLSATILELPQAIEHAAPLLAREGMGERVAHRAGDVRSDDLGEAAYDLIFISSLVHHFDEATNADLARRCARALRPGGYYAILDYVRLQSPKEGGQVAWLMNFYFAMTSRSGAWSFEDMRRWQTAAGLEPVKPIRLRTMPGSGLQAARKITSSAVRWPRSATGRRA